MGFLDSSGDVFIDAVLTDEGRERLARNDGTFLISRWRLGDDEIDYRFWNELTGSDSKDRKIQDTPILEAPTNEAGGLKYGLISIRNSKLLFMPQLVAKPTSVSLKEQTDSVGGGTDVTVSQEIARAQTILPVEIIDYAYIVECDNDLVYVNGESPVAVTPFNVGRYIIPAAPGRRTIAGGTECKFNVRVQTLTSDIFDTLAGATAQKPRSITTNVVVTGQNSNLRVVVPVTIQELATS
jgi:hypothetical protein